MKKYIECSCQEWVLKNTYYAIYIVQLGTIAIVISYYAWYTFWFATSMCHRGAINMGFCFKSKKKLKEGYKISAIQIIAYIIGLSHCFSEKIAQEYREHMI